MPNSSRRLDKLFHREKAIGSRNNINLIYSTSYKFIPGSLEVEIDGSLLDAGVDFVENPNLQSFEIKLGNLSNSLKHPPVDSEEITVRYMLA